MTRLVSHPNGPRLYLCGRRIHHGSAGCALAVLGALAHRRSAWLAGALMVAHDARDFPWRDSDNH